MLVGELMGFEFKSVVVELFVLLKFEDVVLIVVGVDGKGKVLFFEDLL